MPSLCIAGARTVNQLGQNATLFDPFRDALALTLDVAASADLLALPSPAWTASFQIVRPRSDTVVYEHTWGGYFNWGQWFWISVGNNWGPPADYTTIERFGLSWARGQAPSSDSEGSSRHRTYPVEMPAGRPSTPSTFRPSAGSGRRRSTGCSWLHYCFGRFGFAAPAATIGYSA